MFDTLSARLDKVFTSLRGKGRLSDADIDATAREIRVALLEADVALPVVTDVHRQRQGAGPRRRGRRSALNPAQQVIKIVNEELVGILGGGDGDPPVRQDTTDRHPARRPAGLRQDDAGRQARPVAEGAGARAAARRRLTCSGPTPSSSCRSSASAAGVEVFAPEPGSGVGDPVRVARDSIDYARRRAARRRGRRHRRPARHRRRDDAAGDRHPRRRRGPTRSCSSSTR